METLVHSMRTTYKCNKCEEVSVRAVQEYFIGVTTRASTRDRLQGTIQDLLNEEMGAVSSAQDPVKRCESCCQRAGSDTNDVSQPNTMPPTHRYLTTVPLCPSIILGDRHPFTMVGSTAV